MQKIALALAGLALAAIGFGAGHQFALRSNPMTGIELPKASPPSQLEGISPVVDALIVVDPFQRVEGLAALLQKLGPDAVPEVDQALETNGVDADDVEITMLTRFWARYEPAAATEWAFSKPALSLRPLAIMAAVEEWASTDPQAALAGIRKITGGARGTNVDLAEVALMRGWFDSGQFAGVEDFLLSMGPSFEQQRCISAFAREMIQRAGTGPAEAWAEAIPDEPEYFKLAVFRQVSSELTQADPAVGVAWCEKHCNGPFGDTVRQLVATRWAARDGQAAMEWLSKAPEGKDRDRAVITAYRRWWQKDQGESASHWLASIGIEGFQPWMAPAVAVYAPQLAHTDPQMALKWAAFVEDERKTSVLISIARNWRQHDPAAADAWIEQSSLTQDQREKARVGAKRRPGA